MLASSPYSVKRPFDLDIQLPAGLLYRIQLGAFSKPLSYDKFGGMFPITGESLQGGVVKYFAGLFNEYAKAQNALLTVQSHGYKDAFIVAWYNGAKLPVDRASILEKK
jgi:hypothetical protein